jgi:hypothetical protein
MENLEVLAEETMNSLFYYEQLVKFEKLYCENCSKSLTCLYWLDLLHSGGGAPEIWRRNDKGDFECLAFDFAKKEH